MTRSLEGIQIGIYMNHTAGDPIEILRFSVVFLTHSGRESWYSWTPCNGTHWYACHGGQHASTWSIWGKKPSLKTVSAASGHICQEPPWELPSALCCFLHWHGFLGPGSSAIPDYPFPCWVLGMMKKLWKWTVVEVTNIVSILSISELHNTE